MHPERTKSPAARRLWTVGLNLSRDTNDPWGVDLTGHLLVDMAEQALHLDRPDEAERLVKVGLAADVGTHPVSGRIRCLRPP